MLKMTHAELVDLAVRWLKKPHRSGQPDYHSHMGRSIVLREMTSACFEKPDAIGFGMDDSILIEAKASYSDFKADLKKWFRIRPGDGAGDYRYYLCPEGLIPVNELPERWGLLYVDKRNKVTIVKWAERMPVTSTTTERALLLAYINKLKNKRSTK